MIYGSRLEDNSEKSAGGAFAGLTRMGAANSVGGGSKGREISGRL